MFDLLPTNRARIEEGTHYQEPKEVEEDIRLTFANARQYNPPGTDVYVMATTMMDRFEEKWSVSLRCLVVDSI